MRRSSRVIGLGVLFVVLGLGNWSMGSIKMAQYKQRQLDAVERGGHEVEKPFRGTASILEERTEAHELYEDARARYRYYKLVRRGGRFLMTVGGILVLGALVRRLAVPSSRRHRALS